uniref:Uncharacterized protein n=1 Tax=viral metagenome TaxID=1070528 RepID=A0A6C0JE53_9ZZZZ
MSTFKVFKPLGPFEEITIFVDKTDLDVINIKLDDKYI